MSQATATLFFDKRKSDTGFGVVKVCVTFERKQRLRTTGLKISKIDWDKLQRSIDENGLSQKIKNDYLIKAYEFLYGEKSDLVKARKIIDALGDKFNLDLFLYSYDEGESVKEKETIKIDDAIQALMKKYEDLSVAQRVGTAELQRVAANSFVRFLDTLSKKQRISFSLPPIEKDTRLPFSAITPSFLEAYEAYMLQYGRTHFRKPGYRGPASETTIAIYLQELKTVYNTAVKEKIIDISQYPFGVNKYITPVGENTKKALKKLDIEKIMEYPTKVGSAQDLAKCIWVFSYLSNGMNLADICRLKWENINTEDKKIEFVRAKTVRTTKGKKRKITTMIFPVLEIIIERFGNKDKVSGYVFPFLNNATTEKEIKQEIHKLIVRVNSHMKDIGKDLGISEKLVSYVARHSFATILARNNTSILFISQSLGHKNIETTQKYLAGFEEEQVQEYLKALI